jgi:4-amino-4-deoxy-L-arabinose transferase-like glycosyltransferase
MRRRDGFTFPPPYLKLALRPGQESRTARFLPRRRRDAMPPLRDRIRSLPTTLTSRLGGSSASWLRVFAPSPTPTGIPDWRRVLATVVDLLVLATAVILYCRGILDLGSASTLPGQESEVFQSLDWTLVHAVREAHVFPLWNPYLDTGMPYVADPMLHAYNPLVSLLVILIGMPDGFRIALALSFFVAAAGMWYLAGALGMGRPVRLWCGLMFAFAGQPTARAFQGQYLFILGFAWIPWAFAFLIQALRTRPRLHAGLAVICLALIFFSGNAYYSFFVLLAGGLLAVAYLPHISRARPFLRFDVGRLKVLAAIGGVALGLVAVQLLPQFEFLPRIAKSSDVRGSQTPLQVLLDYTSKDRARPDAYSVLPAPEEFYAFLGAGPLLAMVLAPLAWRRGDRRALLFFTLLLGLTFLWIGLDYLPWGDWLASTRLLGMFRHLLRILVIGNLAIIVLAGAGLDAVLSWLGKRAAWKPSVPALLARGGQLGLLGLLAFMAFDVFSINSTILYPAPQYEPAYAATRWIREHDPGDFFVYRDPNNGWWDAIIGQKMVFLDSWYHFDDIHQGEYGPSDHRVAPRPHYLMQAASNPAPTDPGTERIYDRDGVAIFRLPESLPLAFVVDEDRLSDLEHTLTLDEVSPLTPFFPTPNRAEVIIDGKAAQKLVLLVTAYPGWTLEVDGRAQPLSDISGNLAASVQPGVHRYAFSFRPASFIFGLTISLIALMLAAAWIIADWPLRRSALSPMWASLRADLQPTLAAWSRRSARLRTALVRLLAGPQRAIDAARAPEEASESGVLRALQRALRRLLAWACRLDNALFILAMVVYLAVRLIKLANFPIWFFADEAIQTLLASDFVRDGLRDFHGYLFPTYFLNVYGYNENLTVYVQVIPYLLFGKSVFVTRATSVLVTAFGALAVGLILRRIFRLRMPWIGILLLSCAPAWFLHSRTAFETTHMASYYAWFLYCYLRYRTGSPRAVFPAAIFAAATFYTTGAGEIIIAGTGLLFILFDARYHWSQRRWLLRAVPVVLLLTLPYIRFRLQMGAEHTNLLRLFDSYWLQDLPFGEKLSRAVGYYAYAISPGYWFFRNMHDGARHVMDGYGNLMTWTLPFAAGGLALTLWRIRQPEYRVLLVPLLAVPLGGVVVDVGITRVLPFVIPVSLLTALAIDALFALVKPRAWRVVTALAVFAALTGVNAHLLRDSLVNGPFWNRNYGMEIPWGGPQVYGTIAEWHAQEPDAFFVVSPTWANGVDTLRRFFLPDDFPIDIANADRFTEKRQPLDDKTILVLTASEYEAALVNPKLADIRVEELIPYPDGSPGFYFIRMRYSAQADAIFEQERLERLKPVIDTLVVDGSTLTIEHPLFDSGGVQHLFDGDPYTLARGYEANPMVLKITFDTPRPVHGMDLTTGSMDFALTVRLFAPGDSEPVVYAETYTGLPNDPTVSIDFDEAPAQVSRLEMEVLHLTEPPGAAKIHLREIHFR